MASPSMSLELFEVIFPEGQDLYFEEGAAQRTALSDKCLAILGPKVAKEAIEFFGRKGGIQNLSEAGRFRPVKYCLFYPNSPIWKSSLRNDLLERVRKGLEDFDAFVNVREYFNLLLKGLTHGLDSVAREDIVSLLGDYEFVSLLWQTVTSRGIQYRMQSAYLKARQTLINYGAPDSILLLTEELQSRLKEEKAQNSPSSEGVAQAVPSSGSPQLE